MRLAFLGIAHVVAYNRLMKTLGILSALLLCLPFVAQAQTLVLDTQEFMKATVVEVHLEEEREIYGTDTMTTYQELLVTVHEGSEAGTTLVIENDYLPLAKGDMFYLRKTIDPTYGSASYTISEPYRLPWVYGLSALFLGSVLLFGGWQGIRGLVSLVGSLLLIFFVLLPGVLAGYSPIMVALGTAALIVTVGSYVTHGFTRTTTAAVLGMVITVGVTGVLALISVYGAHLTGFVSDAAVYVNFNARGQIDLSGLLLGGILIGLLGVLYDAAIGQSVSVEELHRAGPHLPRTFIYQRAVRIGREHIGALVNTLAIAYVGAALPLLLLVYTSEESLAFIINREVFATEIIRTMVGSIGLVLTVPITTLIAVWLLVKPQKGSKAEIEAEKEHATHAHVH